jgi:hypothetical protein
MRPKRFVDFKQKIKDMLQSEIEKFDNFVDFKKSIISGNFKNLEFKDKDTEDYWNLLQSGSWTSRARPNRWIIRNFGINKKASYDFLFNIFNEVKGRPERAKHFSEKSKGEKTERFECRINSIEDLKILEPYKSGESFVYNIIFPKGCLDALKNAKSKMTEGGSKKYTFVYISKNNEIHFPKGVPEELRGNNLGHWIYLAMIKKLGYITSTSQNSHAIKQIYFDLISDPEFNKDILTLVLDNDILIFDRQTKLDVLEIFKDFIFNKYTSKSGVKCSPELEKILGEDYSNWKKTLSDVPSENSLAAQIKKYDNQKPGSNDYIYDKETKSVLRVNGIWGENISMIKNFKIINLPYDKNRFKVIKKHGETRSSN